MALGWPCRLRRTGEDASCARASPLAAAVRTEAEAAVGAAAPVPPTAAREEDGGAVVDGWEEAISSNLVVW